MFTSQFTGNLGADPDFRYMPDGTPVMQVNVGVSTGKDKATLWIRVSIFGQTAERLAAFGLKKGSRVVVTSSRAPDVKLYERKAGGSGISYDVRGDWMESVEPSPTSGAATKSSKRL